MALTDSNRRDTEKIIDISIDPIRKQKFRINGDPSKIIELDPTDLNISERLETAMDIITKQLIPKLAEIDMDTDDAKQKMRDVDMAIREQVDYIFDFPVSEKCVDGGTMYDPKNGGLRYEHIIESLLVLYANNIQSEFTKLKQRVNKHTAKYTGPTKKSSGRRK